MRAYLLPASMALLALAIAFATLAPARAEPAFTPVCAAESKTSPDKRAAWAQEWIRAQHARGATHFDVEEGGSSGLATLACAW